MPETGRAWHAGRSYWRGKTGLNDQSIGIEIVNQSYCKNGDSTAEIRTGITKKVRMCFFPDYPEAQIAVVIDLLKGIQERHPNIKAIDFIGHSDIAPGRKIDPGPRFPWERLYQVGIGAWFDDDTALKYLEQFTARPMTISNIQKALNTYGYGIEQTGILDEQTRNVLQAFQLHFRPMNVNGEPTLETQAILYALIEKYHAGKLEGLLKIDASPAYSR